MACMSAVEEPQSESVRRKHMESMVVTSMPRTILDDASCVKYGLFSSTCQEKSNSSVIKAQRVTEFSPAALILNFTLFREARDCNLHHAH